MSRFPKVAKTLLFGVVALLLLVIGSAAAQLAWQRTHHRYDLPSTGYYYGSAGSSLSYLGGIESDWSYFGFRGKSPWRWYWTRPTNFTYTKLQLEWFGGSTNGHATLHLPSFVYEMEGETGKLTHAVLTQWLPRSEGYEGSPTNDLRLAAIMRYLRAASDGELPPPRHHGIPLEEPLHGSLQHFHCGIGVGWTVYLWIGIWLALVIHYWRRWFGRKQDSCTDDASFPP
jgi:hypothetical protein